MRAWRRRLEAVVEQRASHKETGHGYWHSMRVANLCELLATAEDLDEDVMVACALLHDLYADKNYARHAELAAAAAPRLLERTGFPVKKIAAVQSCIRAHDQYRPHDRAQLSREVLAFQDADRVDALGAIGIARAFAFGGSVGRQIWIPKHYQKDRGTWKASCRSYSTIDHFNDKLLHLVNMMNTATGKRLARHRHEVMCQFLREFFSEWNESERRQKT